MQCPADKVANYVSVANQQGVAVNLLFRFGAEKVLAKGGFDAGSVLIKLLQKREELQGFVGAQVGFNLDNN